jgi:hypothetical protein
VIQMNLGLLGPVARIQGRQRLHLVTASV